MILEEIKSSISQSNQATTFFNKHIQSFERYNESVNVAVAKNDSAFQEAVSQLSEATQKQFDSFNTLISGFDSKLSEAFTQSVEIFTKTMDEQVRRSETAFETGRPKFEKLDNLDKLVKLEAIEDRLGSLEVKLVNVISNGNKDIVAALAKGINSSENVFSKNDEINVNTSKKSFLDKIIPVFKFGAYTTIISYGIHSFFIYFDILRYIQLILK